MQHVLSHDYRQYATPTPFFSPRLSPTLPPISTIIPPRNASQFSGCPSFPIYPSSHHQSSAEMAQRAHFYNNYQQTHPASLSHQPRPFPPQNTHQNLRQPYHHPQHMSISSTSSTNAMQHHPHHLPSHQPPIYSSSIHQLPHVQQSHVRTSHSDTNHALQHSVPTCVTQRSQQPLQPRQSIRYASLTRGGTPMNTGEQFVTVTPELNNKAPRRRRRPPYSYSSLIAQAILHSPEKKLTLKQIYKWIMDKYPTMYKPDDTGWQNTIRHNLSLNKCFKRVPRSDTELGPGSNSSKGKGGYWAMDPEHMSSYHDGSFARGGVQRRRAGETTSSTAASSPRSAAVDDDATSDCAQSDSPRLSKSSPGPTISDTYSDGALSPITPEAVSLPSPISINGHLGLGEGKNDTHIDVCPTDNRGKAGQLMFQSVHTIETIDVKNPKKGMKDEVTSYGNDKNGEDSTGAMHIRHLLN